ncbi:MAG: transglutaminase domain-containing protein [Lachnospiraceae bacterium]|nr:transglutaminase domain-containing protein [Lachnospiraceae bacterium]
MKRKEERILQTLLVFLMMAGTVLAFYEQVGDGSDSVLLWCCLSGFAWLLVCYGNRPGMRTGVGWLIFLPLILAAAWYFREGWQVIADKIFCLYERYYDIKIPLDIPAVRPDVVSLEGALWTLGALSGVGAAYGLTGRKKQMLFLLQFPVLLLLLLLLGGVAPSILPVSLCFLSALGSIFYLRLLKGGSRPEMAGGFRFFFLFLGIAAALFLSAQAVRTPVYRSMKESRAVIEAKIGDFQDYRWDQILKRLRGENGGNEGRTANMGISGGQIGQVGELIPGDGIDLVLNWQGTSYTGRPEPGTGETGFTGEIYIRAFAADHYEGNNWKSTLGGEGNSSITDIWKDAFYMNPLPLILGANLEGGMVAKDLVTVTIEGADENYLYVPGMAGPSDAANYRNRNYAVWEEGQKSRETLWDVYRPGQADYREAFLDPQREDRLTLGYRESSALSVVDAMVPNHFLDVPEEVRAGLNRIVTEAAEKFGSAWIYGDLTDREEQILTFVREILWERARYTYAPGVVPEGEDLILWFLTENEKGYCTHFASAGVMLFRMLGIPARYCEGYKVMGNGRQTIEVKNRNAHAWVEIYRTGLGWIPVEVTPGYIGQTPEEGPLSEPETEPEEEPESESGTGVPISEDKTAGGNGNGSSGLGLFLALAAGIGGAFLIWGGLKKRRFGRKRPVNRRQKIEGYCRNREELERDYGGRIFTGDAPGGVESALSPEEETALNGLYEEAVFSDHAIGAKAVAFAADCYERTVRFYGTRLTGAVGVRFRFRYRKEMRRNMGDE